MPTRRGPFSQRYLHFACKATRALPPPGPLSNTKLRQGTPDDLTRVGPCWYPIQNSGRGAAVDLIPFLSAHFPIGKWPFAVWV